MISLPAWQRRDLPHPPAFTLRNAVRVIGPGTILLGVSLGAGDWLLGPATVVKHGPALLWVCTLSVILPALLNTDPASLGGPGRGDSRGVDEPTGARDSGRNRVIGWRADGRGLSFTERS